MDLTLTDAWALWWSGQQLTDHTLYGAPVLWLGRAGKMLAFLAGCTIVLDIIGSERLIAWGEQIQTSKGKWIWWTLVPLGALLVPWVSVLAFRRWDPPEGTLGAANQIVGLASLPTAIASLTLGTALTVEKTPAVVIWFGRLLARPRFEWWLRVVAAPLFFVGFALDYLAS
ncbi:hypothetical protein [Nocardiopsis sp. YSL2]|uniref:hypothetical protein n=1 Tax=Nocardiopsis sp. YSL2 TaxID=2939492 RepID=UPI0026F45080|nr:hypothetical protein [Nocardiopsis sp. YSL2]